MAKKRKAKIVINNRLKGSYAAMDPKTNRVEVNIAAHRKNGKLDKAELASSVAHELRHVTHPKETEKQVYSATAKTKISPEERSKLLARLRTARIIRKSNALKKKYKVDGDNPGDIYQKANAQKPEMTRELPTNPNLRTAIMGIM